MPENHDFCELSLFFQEEGMRGQKNNPFSRTGSQISARFKQRVSKQGERHLRGDRDDRQCDVAATRCADNVLASDCRAQFGRPSTRRGCRIHVTVRLQVRPRGETMYWQANVNNPISVTPLPVYRKTFRFL